LQQNLKASLSVKPCFYSQIGSLYIWSELLHPLKVLQGKLLTYRVVINGFAKSNGEMKDMAQYRYQLRGMRNFILNFLCF